MGWDLVRARCWASGRQAPEQILDNPGIWTEQYTMYSGKTRGAWQLRGASSAVAGALLRGCMSAVWAEDELRNDIERTSPLSELRGEDAIELGERFQGSQSVRVRKDSTDGAVSLELLEKIEILEDDDGDGDWAKNWPSFHSSCYVVIVCG